MNPNDLPAHAGRDADEADLLSPLLRGAAAPLPEDPDAAAPPLMRFGALLLRPSTDCLPR